MLLDKSLDSLKARGVRIDREQLESLIESAEGENLAAILSVADCVGSGVKRWSLSLLSRTRLRNSLNLRRFLHDVQPPLFRSGKSSFVSNRQGLHEARCRNRKEAFKQINTAEEKLTSPNLSEAARATLKNNVKINHEILEVVKFYTRHLNKRTKELLEIREKPL